MIYIFFYNGTALHFSPPLCLEDMTAHPSSDGPLASPPSNPPDHPRALETRVGESEWRAGWTKPPAKFMFMRHPNRIGHKYVRRDDVSSLVVAEDILM